MKLRPWGAGGSPVAASPSRRRFLSWGGRLAVWNAALLGMSMTESARAMGSPVLHRVQLPEPRLRGKISVEAALHERRSIREFRDAALTLSDLSQILWAAQGVTNPSGFRTAPSAGALYPLECHLLAGRVSELPVAIYRYDPLRHDLSETVAGDRRAELARAAVGQTWIAAAAAILVLADRKSTRLNSSHSQQSRMPSSA